MANYLISSSTINQMYEEIQKISQGTFVEKIDSNSTDLATILEEISYNSLFSEKRIIQINNADYFTTQKVSGIDPSIIEKYLLVPNQDTTIIFTTMQKIDERKKITKIIKEQGNLIICPSLTIKDIVKIIEKKLLTEGYKISSECLYFIVNNSQNNYDLSLQQLNKIFIYYQEPTTVSLSDLKNIISMNLENNNFKLIDAIINQDITHAFKIYNDLRVQKTEPLIIFNLLAREYRFLYLVNLMLKKHYSPFEIAKKLSIQTWQAEKYINNASKYSIKELKELLCELANIDFAIKKGQKNKHLALEAFILKNA